MMMQRRSKQIRSAEAKQKHSAISIGGEMARGSRHAVVAAAISFALRERASASSQGEERAQCACALGGRAAPLIASSDVGWW